ncbi:GNAT family N-acetyltransferase [Streptomyces sp. NBC_01537]|uniref:GNAT family N-acetyltransferase n=1 Tax=Streptomyces sp. NBC_01537 TaxID=2903896 RepID=UPI00386BB4EB
MPDGVADVIRQATAADATAIAHIHSASREATMPYLPPRRRSDDEVRRWVEQVVLKECRVWVAVRDGEVLGYAVLEGAGLLDQLYLLPGARRRGIGTLLLDEVRRHSPGGLSLHVFQANADARAFYERHGFTVTDTNDGSANMENLPQLTYGWKPASQV